MKTATINGRRYDLVTNPPHILDSEAYDAYVDLFLATDAALWRCHNSPSRYAITGSTYEETWLSLPDLNSRILYLAKEVL